jgi:acyl carrier protein
MDKILSILTEIRPEFDFSTSQDFIRDGMLDSLDVVSLVSSLDSTFGISIRGIEIVPENFRNVSTIRALLSRHGVKE